MKKKIWINISVNFYHLTLKHKRKRVAFLMGKQTVITIIYTDKMHEKPSNIYFISFLPIKKILTNKVE